MYFIENRIKRYIEYYSTHNLPIKNVIEDVNCNLDYDYYSLDCNANTSLNNKILVNKYYKLDKDYEPMNLIEIDNTYSLKGSLVKEAANHFVKMAKSALKDDMHIINTSPYRSYKRQQELYNNNDNIQARPGYSEHQTGLAVDIRTPDYDIDNFINTKECEWLIDNAYKYGFILRYPKNKEKQTGYSYEPWHYRYVGISIALYIKKHNITFDEYYAYFIEPSFKTKLATDSTLL